MHTAKYSVVDFSRLYHAGGMLVINAYWVDRLLTYSQTENVCLTFPRKQATLLIIHALGCEDFLDEVHTVIGEGGAADV